MKHLGPIPTNHLLVLGFSFLLVLLPGCQRKKAPFEGKTLAELEDMLDHTNPTVQAQGAMGLGALGEEAAPAVPKLAEALKSPDSLVRQNAAQALGKIGPKAKTALVPLIEVLKDPEW